MSEDKKEKGADKAPPAPVAKEKGIEVVALMKGFYGNTRKNEGDKFVVAEFGHLGSWMRCTDKGLQEKHEAAMAAKKAAAKAKAGK